jgi:hypothetical protein
VKFSESQITNITKVNPGTLHIHSTLQAMDHLNAGYFKTSFKKHETRFDVHNLIQLAQYASTIHTLEPKEKYTTIINSEGEVNLVCVLEDNNERFQSTQQSTNLSIFDVNFLRKEKIYAKLKYSRSPQYDIVSGGLAAILSGFLGFLICEKFGLELLDSGDFYMAFMYGVFIIFTLRPLLRSVNGFKKDGTYTPNFNILSPQIIFNFYQNLITLLLKLRK